MEENGFDTNDLHNYPKWNDFSFMFLVNSLTWVQ